MYRKAPRDYRENKTKQNPKEKQTQKMKKINPWEKMEGK